MTLEDFEDALDRHGGDLARWPEDLRQEAETLLAQTPEARELLREAQELDAALAPREAAPGAAGAASALADRIMTRVAEHEVQQQNQKAEASARRVGLGWLRRLLPTVSWQIPRELVAMGCGTLAGVFVGAFLGMGLNSYWPAADPQAELFSLFIRSYY